jgi:hypothetical protein
MATCLPAGAVLALPARGDEAFYRLGLTRGACSPQSPVWCAILSGAEMLYATLYIDEGNLLTWHEDRAEAEADVLEVVDQDPSVAEGFGFVALDDEGRRVDDFVSGADLVARRAAAA